MKSKSQTHNWVVDLILFWGFIVAFFLDLTGLTWHQWLGVFIGVLSGYHLLIHWKWVRSVTLRFFSHTSGQARIYYLLDIGLLAGFALILLTGLVISTWLDLPLGEYAAWLNIHITSSITALVLLVLKIGVHWRWIVNTFERRILVPKSQLALRQAARTSETNPQVSRRDFLSLMGVVGAASLLASVSALSSDSQDAAAAAQSDLSSEERIANLVQQMRAELAAQQPAPSTQRTAALDDETAIAASNSTSGNCVVRCNRGCSYPGHCRKYVDSNQNNLCDLGECA